MKDKFIFNARLYLGESINVKKVDRIKKMLIKRPLQANVYLIVPAHNEADQLDILDARQLVLPHYRNMTFLVLGIAADYDEAMVMIEQIVRDCLKERGDCKLREYLLCQQSS